MYDVFFLSFDEPNADKNWESLKKIHPIARRVNGIRGIHDAHKHCARKSRTSHFFVVDADNEIILPEIFEYSISEWDRQYVHLWYAKNPLNDLVYGWGGVKLFSKNVFDNMEQRIDMTTSFPLKIIEQVASITNFNVSPFETWRSAFRETVKLTLSEDPHSKHRLDIWKTQANGAFAEWCLKGASDGSEYALSRSDDQDALCRINDYEWLHGVFSKYL